VGFVRESVSAGGSTHAHPPYPEDTPSPPPHTHTNPTAEIAADKKGQHEFRTALRRIEIDKEDTQAKLAKNEAYLASFDEKIGPFEKKVHGPARCCVRAILCVVCVCVCAVCVCEIMPVRGIAPPGQYDELSVGIVDLYDNAKVEHGKGIALLISSFDYHPMFKVAGGSGFSGVPFRPK
jgi:hypothetical protein